MDLSFWWGIFGPKGIPAPIKAKVEKALQTVMADPNVRARLAKVDTEPSFAPGPALRAKLENEIKNWSTFIDAKGIRVELIAPPLPVRGERRLRSVTENCV